jgi:mannose-6-phosphate isomerase
VTAHRVRPARVHRFYRGGALLGRLRGEEEPDGPFPEDWLGSVTEASNTGHETPNEGLSLLADGRLLSDAIAEDPRAWLGDAHLARFGTSTALLVKLLDTAERLPVHAHPDRAFAREHLDSQFGKTEAWFVVATRSDNAPVWVGLREDVYPTEYRSWIERQETEALLGSLNQVTVRAGDLVYVPAGVPHAIGAGVLITELQEPTDFSIVCEWKGFPIAPDDAHLGLGWDLALDALDLRAHAPIRSLPDETAAYFWADDRAEAAGRFCVLLVLEGRGAIDGTPAAPGDAFVVPAVTRKLEVVGDLRVLRCLAPRPT